MTYWPRPAKPRPKPAPRPKSEPELHPSAVSDALERIEKIEKEIEACLVRVGDHLDRRIEALEALRAEDMLRIRALERDLDEAAQRVGALETTLAHFEHMQSHAPPAPAPGVPPETRFLVSDWAPCDDCLVRLAEALGVEPAS
jgi:hypothetical protein